MMRFEDMSRHKINVHFEDLPIWRDTTQDFVPIETLLGTMHSGCSFGQLCFQNLAEPQYRFYSTIAVSNTYCITLSRQRLIDIVATFEKRLLNDRREFMLNI